MLVLCLSFAIVIIDQFTKHLVLAGVSRSTPIEVIPGFFSITHVRNTGAAWGILAGFGDGLIILSVVMLFVIIVFRRHIIGNLLLDRLSMALMIAGIIGNLIDRIKLGYVVDFLDFYLGSSPHFPSFNVADSAICVGVVLYLISHFMQVKKARRLETLEKTGTSDEG
jgi:signal peptidase II